MPRPSRDRRTIELAPAVSAEIQDLVESGQWLSFQEFAREALKEKLDRWKKEHPLGVKRQR
jgi:Arc/MetJ-type ribon-helix-helix transcriptional regulator